MKLRPKNWEKFQHYKDRRPPWIRLHSSLLNDREFNKLSGNAAKFLVLFWLLASETVEGIVDEDATDIAFRMRITVKEAQKCLKELKALDFIEQCDGQTTTAKTRAELHGFGTRYISDKTKAEVFERDGGKCRDCGSTEHIEYDHIIPVSKKGSSGPENVQLLCRACNRKKRNRLRQAEQVATQSVDPCYAGSDDGCALRTTEAEESQRQRERQSAETPPPSPPVVPALAPKPQLAISPGANGEFIAATALLQDCEIAATNNDIRIIAQVIQFEAKARGVEGAMNYLKAEVFAGRARGEPVSVFWLKDRKYLAKGKDIYADYVRNTA